MNVVSLFTGVGGFDLGLERAGHRIVAQCEADGNARKVLRRHWPDIPVYDDVCTYDPTEFADLICGGFPCQDLSVAGKRAGLAGERSGLFFEAARISDLVLGDGGWVLIENVPGLLSSNGGRDFAVVLATLADLGFHDLAWRVLDSRFFGVPQRRRRVFILARRASGRRAAEVLLEPESGGGNHQASREARARVARTPSGSVANALDRRQGGADDNDAQANHLVADTLRANGANGGRYDKHPLVAPCLSTKSGQAAGQDLRQPGALVTDGSFRESASGSQGDAVLPATDDGRRETGSGSSGSSHPDPDIDKQSVSESSEFGSDGTSGNPSPNNRVSSPPDSDGMRTPPGISGRVDDPVYGWADELMDRPRENEIGTIRIGTTVGAPTPSLVFGQGRAAGPTSPVDPRPDGPRYAQMGNAVTVNVAQWIGERLRDFG